MTPEWRVPEWFPDLTKSTLEKLKMFHVELLKFNQSINLIGPSTVKEADLHHFSDCICAIRILRDELKSEIPIYDFGSGNGFPGIVLSLLSPNLNLFLVESDERKSIFLKTISDRLELNNVRVINQRIESVEFNQPIQGICRALGSLKDVISLLDPKIPEKSVVFHFKGAGLDAEIAQCSTWNVKKLSEYRLPVGKTTRFLVSTTK